MKSDSKNFPPATERTLQILDLYLKDPASKTLKTISDQLNIPFASLYRIVSCMQEYRYLTEDPARPNHFRLGYRLSLLSDMTFTEKNLIRAAYPFMKEVSARLNQACQLCMLTETGVCTIEQCLPSQAITYISDLNETIPINTSASGKLLAALMPEREQEAFLKKAMPLFRRKMPNTITDPDAFRSHLKEITARRYSTDNEEYAAGIGCIAVPICLESGKAFAAVGTTGPIELYHNEASFQEILAFLRETALSIEKAFRI